MAQSRKTPQPPAIGDTVTLPTLFGMPARTWLPILYGAVLVLILFVVLLLPGIRSPGALVTVRSVPEGATVLVDGRRVGSTPIEIFVPAGTRRITLERPFFDPTDRSIRVPNRLVASRFFPARLTVFERLTLMDPEAVQFEAARDFSAWAAIGSASAQFQFPWLLSDAISDLVSDPDGASDAVESLLRSVRADVRSDAQLRDYLRASTLAASTGGAATPSHLLSLFAVLVDSADSAPNLPTLAAAAAGPGAGGAISPADEVRASAWYRLAAEEQTTRVLPFTTEAGPDVSSRGRISIAGATFVHLSGGTFVMGMGTGSPGGELERPHVVTVEEFHIQETLVTRAQFRAFLTDVPRWREERRDDLIEAGLATSDYLRSWGLASDPADGLLPATEISWHAAQAYLEWLNQRLPPALAGFRARLPFEEEFEWAVEANGSAGLEAGFRRGGQFGPFTVGSFPGGQFGISDLLGNVWQWMENSFRPADYLVRSHPFSPYGAAKVPASERAVRGGSWANSAQAVGPGTRGSQPPDWATPFLGFRPVLSRVE